MTKIHLKNALLTLATVAFFSVFASAETIHYTGSDFLEGKLEKALKKDAENSVPAISLEGEMLGSKIGIERIRKGQADFGLLMLPDKNAIPEIKAGKWRALPVAYQVTYVVISNSNPLQSLTFNELASIFARFSEKHLDAWESLSATGETLTGKIVPIAGTQATNASATFFQSKVFPRSDFHKDVRFVKSDDLILRELADSYNGIAVLGTPLTHMNPALKAIAISSSTDEKRGTPYTPTEGNIYNEDYPLSIPIYAVYPVEKTKKLLPLLSLFFSDSFAGTLSNAVFMPLPKNIRLGVQKNIDEMKNK